MDVSPCKCGWVALLVQVLNVKCIKLLYQYKFTNSDLYLNLCSFINFMYHICSHRILGTIFLGIIQQWRMGFLLMFPSPCPKVYHKNTVVVLALLEGIIVCR